MGEPIQFSDREIHVLVNALARERNRIIKHARRRNTTLRASVASLMIADVTRLREKLEGALTDGQHAVAAPDQAEAGGQDGEGGSDQEGRQGPPA